MDSTNTKVLKIIKFTSSEVTNMSSKCIYTQTITIKTAYNTVVEKLEKITQSYKI